jgi:hypothetical protein
LVEIPAPKPRPESWIDPEYVCSHESFEKYLYRLTISESLPGAAVEELEQMGLPTSGSFVVALCGLCAVSLSKYTPSGLVVKEWIDQRHDYYQEFYE